MLMIENGLQEPRKKMFFFNAFILCANADRSENYLDGSSKEKPCIKQQEHSKEECEERRRKSISLTSYEGMFNPEWSRTLMKLGIVEIMP